jgi:hypothetical protein
VEGAGRADSVLRILNITQGQWGERIAENIQANAPSDWIVKTWAAPRVIPPIVDDPEEFLPPELPPSDLIIALGDVAGLAQLIPEAAQMCGASAVIAPIDRNESLPPGLARQLKSWLEAMDVSIVLPKPFCSLTEEQYNRTPLVEKYQDPVIQRFAARFGRPSFEVSIEDGTIVNVGVTRDAACGCAQYVAQNLVGEKVEGSVEKAGMLHHHYPCLASMNKDDDYHDTLMHVSGNILIDSLKDEVRSHLAVVYLRPDGLVSEKNEE